MSKVENTAIASLEAKSPDAQVQVIVRPVERPSAANFRTIDPRQFTTRVDYRSALIAERKAHLQPEKEAVVTAARKHGLDASPAGVLNAVFVSGSAGSILQLLDDISYESVNLDRNL